MNEKLLDAARAAGHVEGRAEAGDDATWIAAIFASYIAFEHWEWIGAAIAFALVFWRAHRYYYAHYEKRRSAFDEMLESERGNAGASAVRD